jgi:hypothetical protein
MVPCEKVTSRLGDLEYRMIRDYLTSAIKKSFPSFPFSFSQSSNLVATLHSAFLGIGRLEVYDDGNEATVSISEITHGHFYSDDAILSEEQRQQQIAEDVIAFLRALFADQVLLFRTPSRGTGGWLRLDLSPEPPIFTSGREYFLWSGPL